MPDTDDEDGLVSGVAGVAGWRFVGAVAQREVLRFEHVPSGVRVEVALAALHDAIGHKPSSREQRDLVQAVPELSIAFGDESEFDNVRYGVLLVFLEAKVENATAPQTFGLVAEDAPPPRLGVSDALDEEMLAAATAWEAMFEAVRPAVAVEIAAYSPEAGIRVTTAAFRCADRLLRPSAQVPQFLAKHVTPELAAELRAKG